MAGAEILLTPVFLRVSETKPDRKRSKWRSYGTDLANTHYSPVEQINGTNFNKLEVAWRLKTDSVEPAAANESAIDAENANFSLGIGHSTTHLANSSGHCDYFICCKKTQQLSLLASPEPR